MGKRELIALLNLSSWCLMKVERLFLTVPPGCLQFVIVVFPDHTHLLLLEMASPPEQLVQIQDNFKELFLMMTSTKIDQNIWLC